MGLGTILFELLAGILLFVPATRYGAIVVAVLFHLGIHPTLRIKFLGFHFMWALIVLFPKPQRVTRVLDWVKDRENRRWR